MVHWLTESSLNQKDLAAGRAPFGMLTPAEAAIFDGFKSDKRRQDWLLGRWVAKNLIQSVSGKTLPLHAIEILPAGDGAPEVRVQAPATGAQKESDDPQLTLSISHSADRALCAVVEGQGVALGVDVEQLEDRTETFVRDYFVREEIALVERVSRPSRAGAATAIWSAKEAALKAIRLGLMVEPFAVCCLPRGDGQQGWSPVEIRWDEGKLKRSAPDLTGWWQIRGGFVMVIAVEAGLVAQKADSQLIEHFC